MVECNICLKQTDKDKLYPIIRVQDRLIDFCEECLKKYNDKKQQKIDEEYIEKLEEIRKFINC